MNFYQKRDLNPQSFKELEPKPSMSTNFIILALMIKYSLSDLNRYFLYENQILSLTCLPISPNELKTSGNNWI